MGPQTNSNQSAANRKTKIQETYASKLKQMKAMHSELQTYQSQVSLGFHVVTVLVVLGKRGVLGGFW